MGKAWSRTSAPALVAPEEVMDSESKHTPGPWIVTPIAPGDNVGYAFRISREHAWSVASVANGAHGYAAIDNACLIAAAPDLKAACEAISMADNYDEIEAAKELALAALAKASGR